MTRHAVIRRPVFVAHAKVRAVERRVDRARHVRRLRIFRPDNGRFVGGLIASAAFALYTIAFGVRRARQALIVKPLTLIGTGLLIALVSGLPAVVRGQPFLTALWASGPVAVGTPVIFDVGVFLVVAGVVLMMIFTLAEES